MRGFHNAGQLVDTGVVVLTDGDEYSTTTFSLQPNPIVGFRPAHRFLS
jgi:hypothetical protein